MSLTDKMSFNEFIAAVKEAVGEKLGAEVRLEEVSKNNEVKYWGLVIIEKGNTSSPTIYLENYYRKIYLDTSFEETVSCIIRDYNENKMTSDFDFSVFRDEEYIRPRIRMRLINYEKNKDMLKHTPHRRFLDLAVIYHFEVNIPGMGAGSVIIRDGLYQCWSFTEDDLYSIALENTRDDFEVLSMLEVAENVAGPWEIPEEIRNELDMKVIINREKSYGAAVILHEHVLSYVYKEMGTEKIMLLPSSVHEFLAVPYLYDEDIERFNEMVKCVNENEVSPDEVLSDHIYIYDGHELVCS